MSAVREDAAGFKAVRTTAVPGGTLVEFGYARTRIAPPRGSAPDAPARYVDGFQAEHGEREREYRTPAGAERAVSRWLGA